jgi:hypothetical protein
VIDLHLEDVPGQSVSRYSPPKQPPGFRHGLEDGGSVALLAQKVRCRKPGRAAPDDRDLFFKESWARFWGLKSLLIGPIKGDSLELTDGDGRIDLPSPAGLLAGVHTYSGERPGDGKVPQQDLKGLLVPAGPDKGYISRDVHVGRTCDLTGSPDKVFTFP